MKRAIFTKANYSKIKMEFMYLISLWPLINFLGMEKYKNMHFGKRCFIIGNGPSLGLMDLNLLKGEYTFGSNRIYLLNNEILDIITYYVAVNSLVLKQCYAEIQRLNMPKFLNWHERKFFSPGNTTFFLKDSYFDDKPKFSKKPWGIIWEGATVTYVAMQLAYFMGFSTVYLIGVDHNFTFVGKPHQTVTSNSVDINHFSKDYFGPGFQWQLPDLDLSEYSYKVAKREFEKNNRKIFDATINGKLSIFPKIDYYSIFNNS
jgi:hypothetical protein